MERKDITVKRFTLSRIETYTKLPIITVYRRPTDYPHSYVARLWIGETALPTNLIAVADTLAAVRASIPITMTRIDPSPTDDPCIEEVWI